ncbi:Pentatricopeptide repeat-containing protein [Glycine soja]
MRTLQVIKQCKSISQLHQVHAHSITTGLLPHHTFPILNNILSTLSSLLTTSSNSNSIITFYALSLFHSIPNPSTFSFNTLIRIHTLLLSPLPALHLFSTLRRLSLPPDFHTFPFVLKASAQLHSLSLAQSLHSQALKFGLLPDLFSLNTLIGVYSIHHRVSDAHKLFYECPHGDVVSYNALIHGLVKTRQISRARELFDEMPVRDEISWGTMIAGYSHLKLCNQAIELFNEMMRLEVKPDNIALVSVLSACAQLGELEQGSIVHDYIKRNRIRVDSYLATGLVDLYAKCGCVETARDVFESCMEKYVFTWNAMLVGFAIHGEGSMVLEYFSRMVSEGVKPDGVTLLGVLVGCSHAGLVLEARRIFDEMENVYGVKREGKHYGCMADMLARAGLIEEGVEMVKAMPSGGDVFAWGGLLGGCRIHGNVEVAKKAAQQVMEIKPEDGGVYSVMANIYAHTEQWDDLVKVRRSLSANKRAKKITGRSLIRLNDEGVSSDYKQSVALPEASMATVSTQKTDKCLLASTFSYVAPEPSFFTETHIAFCTNSNGIIFIKQYKSVEPTFRPILSRHSGNWLAVLERELEERLRTQPQQTPKMKAYAPAADYGYVHHRQHGKSDKFIKQSFFRKVAHVQDRSYPNPILRDAYAYTPRVDPSHV